MKTSPCAERVVVTYDGGRYEVRGDETLLAALQRQGATVAFSCERGTCRVCIQRCVGGTPPVAAQRGLDASLGAKGYFLPCICRPTADMIVDAPRAEDFCFTAVVADKRWLTPDVMRLWLEPVVDVPYRAGQFVNVLRPDGLARSYSLASVYGEEPYLELHVQRLPGGVVSPWLCDELRQGEELKLQGPLGDSFYVGTEPQQPLVLVASGTGIAPLYGIAKDALRRKHEGPVYVFHVASAREGLYLHEELTRLQEQSGLCYRAYTQTSDGSTGHVRDRAALADLAFAEVRDIRAACIHVAGQRQLVERCLELARAHDIAQARILADPFDQSTPGGIVELSRPTLPETGPRQFSPDPEMWQALDHGRLLTTILEAFYTRVYADERLSPYFQRITKDRIVGKVYSYLRQTFTGDKVYFGDHPRNAHHWMVIDDDLFGYRAALLEECMRQQGLDEQFVRRWCALEELFRRDIVKGRPVGRIVDGVEQSAESYGQDVLSVAGVCDGCGTEVGVGERVRYHTRLGTTFGPCCHESRASQ